VAYPERFRDILHVDRLALEREGGVACDHRQRGDFGQIGDDVFGNAVAEIFLLCFAAHVGEGKDADRWLRRCLLLRWSSCGARLALSGSAHLHDRAQQLLEQLRLLAIPEVREVDRLILAKAERRPHFIDNCGHEPIGIPSFGSLVLHPRGLKRFIRPENDHRFGIAQCFVDFRRKPRPAVKLAVPPHIVAGPSDQVRELPRAIDVGACIAEENACHGPSWRAGLWGEPQAGARG
jgi:hypothetical protein